MVKILLVDDDKNLSNELAAWLVSNDHHTVDQAFNGADAELFLRGYSYALIILDWELPDTTGVQILKSYRNSGGSTPVLMLTGRNSTVDKTTGLDTCTHLAKTTSLANAAIPLLQKSDLS